jgi:hypothetical protein
MPNNLICGNCETKNELFQINCSNCNALLRNRVVNIDLWATIWQLIESPTKAIKNIIWAEHKNFVLFISFLIGIKSFTNTLLLSSLFNINPAYHTSLLYNFFLSIIYLFLFLHLFAFVFSKSLKSFGLKSRFKDNYSMLVYSLLPNVVALILLVPVEYALFGKYWFLFNPAPFEIKPLAAYILFGLEGIFFLWSILLLILGFYTQIGKKIISIIVLIIFIAILYLFPVIAPFFPF